MNIKYGNRKFIAFCLLLFVYLLISVSALAALAVTSKSGLDINAFSGLFIPLGSGLAAISVLFFSANAVEHFSEKKENK
jgi:hypothetical protein